jgi:hypothetical protein
MVIDKSCRVNELLKLRIKDIMYKIAGDHQYAEVMVNEKTGSQELLPYNSNNNFKKLL